MSNTYKNSKTKFKKCFFSGHKALSALIMVLSTVNYTKAINLHQNILQGSKYKLSIKNELLNYILLRVGNY